LKRKEGDNLMYNLGMVKFHKLSDIKVDVKLESILPVSLYVKVDTDSSSHKLTEEEYEYLSELDALYYYDGEEEISFLGEYIIDSYNILFFALSHDINNKLKVGKIIKILNYNPFYPRSDSEYSLAFALLAASK
jgi:hypothetical protein